MTATDATDATDATGDEVRPFAHGLRVGTFRPGLWAWSWLGWGLFTSLPLLTGWILKLAFDALSQSKPIASFLVALGLTEAVGWIIFAFSVYMVIRWWYAGMTLLRTNMLHAQTVSGGPQAARLPASAAEATTRFSEDTRNIVLWTDSWLDGFAYILYAVLAMIIMATIDLGASMVVLAPVAVVTLATQYLTPRLHDARSADRKASSAVASFLGEAFAGQLALRLATRESAAIHRLEQLTAKRRVTAVRDNVLTQAIDAFSSSTVDITIGLILLVLVPRVRAGEISVGDTALFVTYALQFGRVPRFLARIITSKEQMTVSMQRMGELMAKGHLGDLVAYRPITIEPSDTMLVRSPDPARDLLDRLELDAVSAEYGVEDVSLTIERGSFTVITGPVGSGKSTLLRMMVGLVPTTSGEIRWNGHTVEDPAEWFVPPRSAHLDQVPKLFSETLRDNITLGRLDENITLAIQLAALETDLDEMPNGLETVVGARGLRLSGGQLQRVATARSLLTQPELLVVDDLSSALDVATERELWLGLAETPITVVAVSQRSLALELADRVVTMDNGRLV